MGGIERFVAAALRQRLFVLLCLAALVATGVAAYRELPVEAFPDLTNNQVVVVTDAPGLAAIEVEQRVSYPIETAVMGVPGAEQVRSISKQGLSIVSIVFADAVPVYFARQLVGERLLEARGRIPDGLEPTLGPVATAFGEIYQYLVEGDAADAMAQEDAARLGGAHAPALGGRGERDQLVGRADAAVPGGGRSAPARSLRPDAAPGAAGDRRQQRLVRRRLHRAPVRAVHRARRRPGRGLPRTSGRSSSRRSRARRSTSATWPRSPSARWRGRAR